MEELKCSCGGMFQSLGQEFIRTGQVSDSLLMGRDMNAWSEGAIPGELFVCSTCRAVQFCADQEWIDKRLAEMRKKEEEAQWAQKWVDDRDERMVLNCMKEFANYGVQKLEKIAENQSWIKYDKCEQEAARRLLKQKRSQPQSQNQRWKDFN